MWSVAGPPGGAPNARLFLTSVLGAATRFLWIISRAGACFECPFLLTVCSILICCVDHLISVKIYFVLLFDEKCKGNKSLTVEDHFKSNNAHPVLKLWLMKTTAACNSHIVSSLIIHNMEAAQH